MKKLLIILMLIGIANAEIKPFQVVNTESTNFPGRNRGKIWIFAPTATESIDRVDTLKKAVLDYATKQNKSVVSGFLVPTKYKDAPFIGNLALIEYVKDGCGIDGKTCNNKIFNIFASTDILTEQQINILDAWRINRPKFLSKDGDLDEDGLILKVTKDLGIKYNPDAGDDEEGFFMLPYIDSNRFE